MISNQQDSLNEISSRQESINGNTYAVKKKISSRINTENVMGYEQSIINTTLAK